MKKIKLPQPYAQMVVCGALGSIPNIFEETKRLEKVFVFAEDFDDINDKGLDFDNKLHQRVWNEMTLGIYPIRHSPPIVSSVMLLYLRKKR